MTTIITNEDDFLTALRADNLSDTLCTGFTVNIDRPNAVIIRNASNLQFEDVNWIGPDDPGELMIGPQLLGGSSISFKRGSAVSLFMGIVHANVHGLIIRNMEFSLRSDGIHGASSDVLITGCRFHDFNKGNGLVGAGDQSNAIQFDNQDSTESAHDITITENIFDQGAGTMFHSIFVKDEVGTLPYRNITISGNHIIGGDGDAIFVSGTDDVRVLSNYVRGFNNQETIYVTIEGADADVRYNTAPGFQLAAEMALHPTNRVIPIGS
jgi:hypothetical protein